PAAAQAAATAAAIAPSSDGDLSVLVIKGWSLLTALKADPAVGDVPVIVLVTMESGGAVALGAADYLTKPVEPARPAAVLRTHCRDRAAPGRGAEADGGTGPVARMSTG